MRPALTIAAVRARLLAPRPGWEVSVGANGTTRRPCALPPRERDLEAAGDLWELGNKWGHDYAPAAWVVRTSAFHGSAELSRHRSPLAAYRARLAAREDGCSCSGPVLEPEPLP